MSNTASAKEVDASIDVGRKKVLSATRTLSFNFHGFARLNHKRGQCIISPTHRCHGHRWGVMLYPRGDGLSSSDDVHISVHLRRFLDGPENAEIEAKFKMQVPCKKRSGTYAFGTGVKSCWGWPDFARRADVLDVTKNCLVDGALTVKIDLQVYLDYREAWTPASTTLKDRMVDLYKSGEFSDVTFKVGDKKILAHKFLLPKSAPILFQLTEGVTEDIEIQDTDPSAFEKMLHFIYTEDVPPDLKTEAKALLDISDKFGCTNLKLFAEAELATNGITIENAAEMFLLADSRSCALLKEAATQCFVDNANEVMASQGFSQVRESPDLLVELMDALANPPNFSEGDEADDIDRMGVSTLRRKLDEAGLDVDGTRQMLVKRLKTKSE